VLLGDAHVGFNSTNEIINYNKNYQETMKLLYDYTFNTNSKDFVPVKDVVTSNTSFSVLRQDGSVIIVRYYHRNILSVEKDSNLKDIKKIYSTGTGDYAGITKNNKVKTWTHNHNQIEKHENNTKANDKLLKDIKKIYTNSYAFIATNKKGAIANIWGQNKLGGNYKLIKKEHPYLFNTEHPKFSKIKLIISTHWGFIIIRQNHSLIFLGKEKNNFKKIAQEVIGYPQTNQPIELAINNNITAILKNDGKVILAGNLPKGIKKDTVYKNIVEISHKNSKISLIRSDKKTIYITHPKPQKIKIKSILDNYIEKQKKTNLIKDEYSFNNTDHIFYYKNGSISIASISKNNNLEIINYSLKLDLTNIIIPFKYKNGNNIAAITMNNEEDDRYEYSLVNFPLTKQEINNKQYKIIKIRNAGIHNKNFKIENNKLLINTNNIDCSAGYRTDTILYQNYTRCHILLKAKKGNEIHYRDFQLPLSPY
jgi:hypothetical protein